MTKFTVYFKKRTQFQTAFSKDVDPNVYTDYIEAKNATVAQSNYEMFHPNTVIVRVFDPAKPLKKVLRLPENPKHARIRIYTPKKSKNSKRG